MNRQQLERQLKERLAKDGYAVELLKQWPAKATYYKGDGEAIPGLPADPWSMQRYLAKGFSLVPPTCSGIEPIPLKRGRQGKRSLANMLREISNKESLMQGGEE